MKSRVLPVIACTMVLACDAPEAGEVQAQNGPADSAMTPVCRVSNASMPLPEEIRESSGLAQARTNGLLWTHNDAGNPAELFALDATGRIVQRVSVTGAGTIDWEDIEAAPCGDGSCLFIADIGDNDGSRAHITIYTIPEPARGAAVAAATAFHVRYPDGPRDAEGMFVASNGDIYIVTKGRSEPVELFRYAQPHRAGATVTLERVRELFPRPAGADERVSAATMSPDGAWVAIRNYRTLFLYRSLQLLDGNTAAEPVAIDLQPLGHRQGESVAIGTDGTVWLTSEAENRGTRPVWATLSCTFPVVQSSSSSTPPE